VIGHNVNDKEELMFEMDPWVAIFPCTTIYRAKLDYKQIKNFYLNTPMKDPQYMRIHISLIPDEIIEE
jgi:hypothetical protein